MKKKRRPRGTGTLQNTVSSSSYFPLRASLPPFLPSFPRSSLLPPKTSFPFVSFREENEEEGRGKRNEWKDVETFLKWTDTSAVPRPLLEQVLGRCSIGRCALLARESGEGKERRRWKRSGVGRRRRVRHHPRYSRHSRRARAEPATC